MVKLRLGLNNRIEVIKNKEIYKSIVQDIREKHIKINIPVNKGEYLSLAMDEEIELIYYDKESSLFNFYCKVIDRVKENNISYYRLSLPYNIKKVQRRNFVRVNVLEFIRYIKENKSLERDKVENPVKKAILLDLSGGGMKIRSKENLKKGDILLININHNDIKLDLKGRVVRVKEDNDDYLCGVSFLNIDSKTREKIIKIVFIILRKQSELV